MPDGMALLTAMAAAVCIAAAFGLAFAWPWRTPSPVRSALGWVIGFAVALYVGAWMLGVQPNGNLLFDIQRYLLVALPAAIAVETCAAWRPTAWFWVARSILALGLTPTILWGSEYLVDPTGMSDQKWSKETMLLVCTGIAVATVSIWSALYRAVDRGASAMMPSALAFLCVVAGITTMLSGYISAGYLGFVLAGGIMATAAASFLVAAPPLTHGALGIAVISYAAILIMGRFFVSLTTMHAVILAAAPLAYALAELIPTRRWIRAVIGLLLIVTASGVTISQAFETFQANSHPSEEPSSPSSGGIQNYLDYGK